MGYCFLHVKKIKSFQAMDMAYKHNYRTVDISNADPDLYHLNEELIKLPQHNGESMTYNDAFNERIKSLPYYKDHTCRSNAVKAIEIVTTFSRDEKENIDVEAWKKANVEWLKQHFNKAPDKDNLVSVVYHADEPGNVHCHALVIPIDQEGKLNCRGFLGGRDKMVRMQNDYAEAMHDFGLERGLPGSKAKHKDIKKFYTDLNQAKILPKAHSNESASEYRQRCLEELETLSLAQKRTLMEKERKTMQKLTESTKEKTERLQDLTNEIEKYEKALTEKKKEFDSLSSHKEFDLEEYNKAMMFFRSYWRGYDMLDPEYQEKARDILSRMDYLLKKEQQERNEHENL